MTTTFFWQSHYKSRFLTILVQGKLSARTPDLHPAVRGPGIKAAGTWPTLRLT